MAFLTRIKQIGIKLEAVLGVAEVLDATNYAHRFRNVTWGRKAVREENDEYRAGLSKQADLVGAFSGELGFEETLSGGTGTTAPPWGTTLQAMGFKQTALKKMKVDTITGGNFLLGDIIGDAATLNAATKSARIMGIGTYGGHTYIVYLPIGGAFANADTVYNYATAQVSGTVAAAPTADGGFAYTPESENGTTTPPSATIEMRDGELINRMVGARGQGSIKFEFGKSPRLQATFQGGIVNQNSDGTPVTGALVTGITLPAKATYLMGTIGQPITIGDELYALAGMQTMTLNLNQTLALDKSIAAGGITAFIDDNAAGGYGATLITDRKFVVSVDPKRPPRASFDFLKKWQSNATMPMRIQVGLLNAAGKTAFTCFGPATSLTSDSFGEQDRDGYVALNQDVQFTGDDDDEVLIGLVQV